VSDVDHAESADVVVIGGGILGCSAAYHLQQAGVDRIVLLERQPALATQTSWAGAGFVSLWAPEFPNWDDLELELEQYALRFYRGLAERHDIGLKDVGMIRIAVTERGAGLLRGHYERARIMVESGREVRALSPAGVAALVPVDASRVLAGVFWPTALRVNAPAATAALGRELERAGVAVRTGVEVTGIESQDGKVARVLTSRGPIATGTVVNAAGAWLHRIGRMVDLDLPAVPLLTSRIVTEPISTVPPLMPTMIFLDYHGMYVREEEGGLLLGVEDVGQATPEPSREGDYVASLETDAVAYRRVPISSPPAVSGLGQAMVERAEWLAAAFAETLLPLAGARTRYSRSGLPTFTPDGRNLLGEAPDLRGFFAVGGDNEAGISHGPGLGKLLAELVVDGRASRDVSPFRLDRHRIAAQHQPA
jgi:glycine/D-amino acid oxidase-like deaminating enzyme